MLLSGSPAGLAWAGSTLDDADAAWGPAAIQTYTLEPDAGLRAPDRLDPALLAPRPAVPAEAAVAARPAAAGPQLAFVDAGVQGHQALIEALSRDAAAGALEVVVLDPSRDGLGQISEVLAQRSGLAAVHILSHGSAGALQLGSTVLDQADLSAHASTLAGWAGAFSEGGDILLYGCDVADGQWGTAFVGRLAALTGADVAASTDATGATALGGDWKLEFRTGSLEAAVPAGLAGSAFAGLLAAATEPTVLKATGIFADKTVLNADKALDLRTFSQTLVWTIKSDRITVQGPASGDVLEVQNVTVLYAGTGQTTFVVPSDAKFGTSSAPGRLIGNTAVTARATVSFTPNLADPDQFITLKRVSADVKLDLGTARPPVSGNAVKVGSSWFFLQNIDTVIGGKGDDVLTANPTAATTLSGGRGDDTLTGGSAGDTLNGGEGADVLQGDAVAEGQGGSTDQLTGGDGDDTYRFVDGWQRDVVVETSGEGKDTLDFSEVTTPLTVKLGGAGENFVDVSVTGQDAHRATASHVENLVLGAGAHTINVLRAYAVDLDVDGFLNRTLYITHRMAEVGGAPEATLNLSLIDAPLKITVEAHAQDGIIGNKVTVEFSSSATELARKLVVFNVRHLIASSKADEITLADGVQWLGNLDGGDGDDVFTLGDQVDFGSAGRLVGGQGTDTVRMGDETVFNSLATLTISDGVIAPPVFKGVQWSLGGKAEGEGTALRSSGIENVVGAGAGDRLIGDPAANRIEGGAGVDLLQGGEGDDTLLGNRGADLLAGDAGDDDLTGGWGDDLLVGGAGDDTMRGGWDSDTFRFTDGWGHDTIESDFFEKSNDILDFQGVNAAMTLSLQGGRIDAGTGTWQRDKQTTLGLTAEFFKASGRWQDADAGSYASVSVDNAVQVKSTGLVNNRIGSILLNGAQDNTLYFGNSWNTTTIKVGAGEGQLTLDFSAVTEKLAFRFVADNIVDIVNLGGLDPTKAVLDNFNQATTIRVEGVGANTVIISGRQENVYNVRVDPTSKAKVQFAGEMQLMGGLKWTRLPLTESSVPGGLSTVGHTIDLGLPIVQDTKKLFETLGKGFVYTAQGLGQLALLKGSSEWMASFKQVVDTVRVNTANLIGGDTTAQKFFGLTSIGTIEGIAKVTLLNDPTFKDDSKLQWLAAAEIANVTVGGGVNFVLGNNLANDFKVKFMRPGVHVFAGMGGPDTYSFGNLWGAAAVLDLPDLGPDTGSPVPEALDTLDFSSVLAADIHVDIYSGTLLDIAAQIRNAFPADDLPPGALDGAQWLNNTLSTNVLLVRAYEGAARGLNPFDYAAPTSVMIATDIESLVGPSFGSLKLNFHGDVELRGTVVAGTFGDVILDYSDYSKPVTTNLDAGGATLSLNGIQTQALSWLGGIAIPDFSSLVDVFPPTSTSGAATGILGNRLGGLTTLFDVAGVSNNPIADELKRFAVTGVSRVIGSAQADTFMLGSSATLPFGIEASGDLFVEQQVSLIQYTLAEGDRMVIDPGAEEGSSAATVNLAGFDKAVEINLRTGEARAETLTWTLAAAEDLPSIRTIVSGRGDDRFTAPEAIGPDGLRFKFYDNWGKDTIDLVGTTGSVFLDFDSIAGRDQSKLFQRVDGNDIVIEQRVNGQAVHSVRVIGGHAGTATVRWSAAVTPDALSDIEIRNAAVIAAAVPATASGATAPALPASATISATTDLSGVLAEALSRWAAQDLQVLGNSSADPMAALAGTVVTVADLDGQELARTRPDGTIVLDVDAAGHGWFLDTTFGAQGDAEFSGTGAQLTATDPAAQGRMDLLTVLMHELGHGLNLLHSDEPGQLMSAVLEPGVRRGVPGGTLQVVTVESSGRAVLDAGLDALGDWAAGLGAQIDQQLGQTTIPFTDTTLASLYRLGAESLEQRAQAAIESLQADLAALFANKATVTTADVLALANASSTTARYALTRAPNSDAVAFTAQVDLLPEPQRTQVLDFSGLALDNAALGLQVNADIDLEVTPEAKLTFVFGIGPDGQFYVDAPTLRAQLSLGNGATPINASVTLGPVGLAVVDGRIDVKASTSIGTAQRLDLQALAGRTVDPQSLEAVTTGVYDIELPVQMTGALAGVEADSARILARGVLPSSVSDLPAFIAGMDLQFENFDQLFELRGISLDQLLDAVSSGLDALVEPGGLLDQTIPGLNRSLNELLGAQLAGDTGNFLEKLKATIDSVRGGDLGSVESALNSAFNALLGTDVDPITLSYQDSRLLLNFAFEEVFAAVKTSFQVDLADYVDELNLRSFLPADAIDEVLSRLTIGDDMIFITADLAAGINFGVGLDLSNLADPVAFISSDSSLYARASVRTDAPFDFDVALDLTGLGLPAGLDRVGFSIDDGMVDIALGAAFGLPGNEEGYYEFGSLPAPELRGQADLDITLPLKLGSLPVGGSELDGDGDGVLDHTLRLKGSYDGRLAIDLTSPQFDQLFSLAAWLNDPQNVINGLDKLFDELGNGLADRLKGLGLPLVGDALDNAAAYFDDGVDGSGDDLRDKVIPVLEQLIAENPGASTTDLIVQALVKALPGLLQEGENGGVRVTMEEGAVRFDLVLAGNLLHEAVALDFGVGDLLQVDGDIDLSVDYQFAFGFGLSAAEGFFLSTDGAVESGEEFLLTLNATLPGLDAQATLPILTARVQELADDDGVSGLYGTFSIDLQDAGGDGRWALLKGEKGSVEVRLQAVANADLALTVSIPDGSDGDGPPLFPTVTAVLHYDQVLADVGTGGASFVQRPTIVFEDVTLDLGEFISGFVAPIAEAVNALTEPLEPIFSKDPEDPGLLFKPIGLLEELGLKDTRLIDITRTVLGQTRYAPVIKAIDAIGDVITLVKAVDEFIDSSPPEGGLLFNFGDFTVNFDEKGGTAAAPATSNPGAPKETANPKANAVLGKLGTKKDVGSFQFPLLNDPSTIFGLLLGKDVDLFIYDMPKLDLKFEYVKSVPIFPGLNARFGGGVSASTNFSLGFDTSGFNQWKAQGFAPESSYLLLNGLFLDDHGIENTPDDKPEMSVAAKIVAGASVGIGGLIEAGVEGNIKAGIDFNLNDVPHPITGEFDGKLRGDELLLRLEHGPQCLFDMHGALTFGLDAFFWVGIDLGFLGEITIFEARQTFASGTLASFDYECPDPVEATLGTLSTVGGVGTLDLMVEKSGGNPYKVSQQTVTLKDGTSQTFIVLQSGSQVQSFLASEVGRIVTDGSSGADEIVIGAGITAALEIDGGAGDDRIMVSSGKGQVTVRGGEGQDEIVVNDGLQADLDVDGGGGEDRIMVSSPGGFTILIKGGAGKDMIVGSDFADQIFGGDGDDVIYGMKGDDTLQGDAGKDVLLGGAGKDHLLGGAGDDRLGGEAGEDRLEGGDGSDALTGGADRDWIDGGRDADSILWTFGDTEDHEWIGGSGSSTGATGPVVDTAQLSGVVVDAQGKTEAFDDRVSLNRVGGTADVRVEWQRTGVEGHARFAANGASTFNLVGIELISLDLGSGRDTVDVGDLDGSTVTNLNVNFGTADENRRDIVDAANYDDKGNLIDYVYVTDGDGNRTILKEERITRVVGPDQSEDVLRLSGSDAADVYTVSANETGLAIRQDKADGVLPRNVLSVALLSAENGFDRVQIDSGKGDDRVDASAVGSFHQLKTLVIKSGEGSDTVVGSPFVDDIDSGLGDDRVTGGGGVDLFADAGGFDRLYEARDVNFTLTDKRLVIDLLDKGEAVQQPDGSFKVTRGVTASEDEDISGGGNGLFEEFHLTAYDPANGLDGVYSVNLFRISDFTRDAILNGGAASDEYLIQLSGGAAASFSSYIGIEDDGGPEGAGIDVLRLDGTNEADTFGFRKDVVERVSARAGDEGSDSAFAPVTEFTTDIIVRDPSIDASLNRQVVNYRSTEDMVIHGLGGNDLFLVDDSSTELFVYGDGGDDRFFIGSVLATEQVLDPKTGRMIEVVKRDGGLTNGVSFPASFYGGKGNDYFEVNHNIAEISLFGEDGDDIFFLKALLTTEPKAADAWQPQQAINVHSTAGEADTLAYVRNAPVNIFGGEGFDTLVIVGTVIDDEFVIFTEFDPVLGREVQRIYGAGLVVPVIDSIERLMLITGAGDDTVHLYGTLDEQEIVINTGGGNDTVHVGGEALRFDITIPESKYTRVNEIPVPDEVTTRTVNVPASVSYTWVYRKLFGFLQTNWLPELRVTVVPARSYTEVVRKAQPPLLVPEVVTVPAYSKTITVPETRTLDKIRGPVIIDGVVNGPLYQDGVELAAQGHDRIVVDNRDGSVTQPGLLRKQELQVVALNASDAAAAAAKAVLAKALPAGVDAEVVYPAVKSLIENLNRVRQPGLVAGMQAQPDGVTSLQLQPRQQIQVFADLGALRAAYAGVATGSYEKVNAVTGVKETLSFSLASLQATGGNAFLPDGLFTMASGGSLGTVQAELVYDVNGTVTGVNVYATRAISLNLGNAFVVSAQRDAEASRTYDALSGFGLGVGVFHERFTIVDVLLSNEDDRLRIDDTTAGATTNVFGGGGDDQIEVFGSSGRLNLFGDVAGPDTRGLDVNSGVLGSYAEDFRDADNAAALGQVLGLGGAFDADDIRHVRALVKALIADTSADLVLDNADTQIRQLINLDVDRYRAQVWELLKSERNTLRGDSGDYRSYLASAGATAGLARDLAALVGLPAGTAFSESDRGHLAALATYLNGKRFALTVEIDLAASPERLRAELDLFSGFVWDVIGEGVAPGVASGQYRDHLKALGEFLSLGQDFDLNSRSHLQVLAGLVNARQFRTTVFVDPTASAQAITDALESFEGFVWTALKQDLVRVADGSGLPYNPLAEFGDYRGQLAALGSLLGLGSANKPVAFDPENVAHVKALAERLNDRFNDLGIDVDGIRLEAFIDLNPLDRARQLLDLDRFRLEIWQLITEVHPKVALPSGDDTFTVHATGGAVTVRGQAGDDTVRLQSAVLGGWLTALGGSGDDRFIVNGLQTLASTSDRGDGRGALRDSVDLDGQDGADTYTVALTGGQTDYRINVLDSGTDGHGGDSLAIQGTSGDDAFLLRQVAELPGYASADTPAFVALVKGPIDEVLANAATRPQSLERVNYDRRIEGGLTVSGGQGDDTFASDNNAARTVLDGGQGADRFFIGQVYTTARVADAVAPQDAFDTIETTRGFLSRGVSFETTVRGGAGDDQFTVYSNGAPLDLQGDEGNDRFEVRAFALRTEAGVSTARTSAIDTGAGDDTIQYNVNAPVAIGGGSGFDTVVILGTEGDDAFVITDGVVYGAGRTVTLDGVEAVQVDGLEGNDRFYVLGTTAGMLTTVIGGLGSDTFQVGGDVTEAIVSSLGVTRGTFPPQTHTLTGIQGPLVIEGHYLQGTNRSLAQPLMLPGESNEQPSDGTVLGFTGTGAADATDHMDVASSAVAALLRRLGLDEGDFNALAGLTVGVTTGTGSSRFWRVDAVQAVAGDDSRLRLVLRNPSVLESAGIAGFALPRSGDGIAFTRESANFFVDESTQIDRVDIFNDGSLVDDQGVLRALGDALNLSGLGMGGPLTLDLGTADPSDDISLAGGITLDDTEILEVLLGQGNDRLDIEATLRTTAQHGGLTVVHGGGNRVLDSGEIGGDTFVVSVGAADSPLVVYGDTAQDGQRYAGSAGVMPEGATLGHRFTAAGNDVLDARQSTRGVVLYGGAGHDRILGGAGGDLLAGGSGNDEIRGNSGVDWIYGDSGVNVELLARSLTVTVTDRSDAPNRDSLATGHDRLFGDGGSDIVFGDHGVITRIGPMGDLVSTALTGVGAVESAVFDQGGDDRIEGGDGADILMGGRGHDTLSGDAGNDLLFGDNAAVRAATGAVDTALFPLVEGSAVRSASLDAGQDRGRHDDLIRGGAGDDQVLGQQGADTVYGDDGDDDLVGGHDVAGGLDAGDAIDGGQGDDVIAGDNAVVRRQAGAGTEALHRTLRGPVIYGVTPASAGTPGNDGEALVDSAAQAAPSGRNLRRITLLDHSDNAALTAGRFGADYLAGGADDDQVFGQLGDDVIQGDGSIGTVGADGRIVRSVGAARAEGAGQALVVNASTENDATDGDDYLEGNGGNDVVFGNLGQDDIVGGSSDLFGLVSRSARPDGRDLLFGGAGTDIARLDAGDPRHARDADTIAGDNANILRLVGADGAYLRFNYDSAAFNGVLGAAGYDTQLRLIPRAVVLLDYTPGGRDYLIARNGLDPATTPLDIGAGDEVHGEAGDDTVYGQLGHDVLFGDAGDDDLIGGTGSDWLSGGTGSDGLLGDDGRIATSRNGTAEPLSGVAALPAAELDQAIATAGNAHQATVNVSGALKKTANLTPFTLDPTGQDPMFVAADSDDLLFGGLGNDFLHGGVGDDGLSGAEALVQSYAARTASGAVVAAVRSDFTMPFNPGGLLAYSGRVAGEFALYDAADPRRKVMLDPATGQASGGAGAAEWLLNFSTLQDAGTAFFSDGDDALFGDLGHDWMVGGTGRDRLYGGYGNDLLNADDDLVGADAGANASPETHVSYEDLAFGGAGRDVLIANTGGDRLIDWAGEFNAYIVPFAPFGLATVSRALQPGIAEFLYALSASDGADPTRAADTGSDVARRGEPNGELGLVLQQDPGWQEQTGSPSGPQPGNVSGGARDVLRSAATTTTTPKATTAAQTTTSTSTSTATQSTSSTTSTVTAVAAPAPAPAPAPATSTAPSTGVAQIPVVASKSAAKSAVEPAAAVIAWTTPVTATATSKAPSTSTPAWVSDFVVNLAQTPAQRNPNANLRLTADTPSRAAGSAGRG